MLQFAEMSDYQPNPEASHTPEPLQTGDLQHLIEGLVYNQDGTPIYEIIEHPTLHRAQPIDLSTIETSSITPRTRKILGVCLQGEAPNDAILLGIDGSGMEIEIPTGLNQIHDIAPGGRGIQIEPQHVRYQGQTIVDIALDPITMHSKKVQDVRQNPDAFVARLNQVVQLAEERREQRNQNLAIGTSGILDALKRLNPWGE